MCRRMLEVVKSHLAAAAVLSLALSPMPLAARESRAQSAPTTTPLPAPPPALAEPDLCTEKLTPPGFTPSVLAARTPPEYPEADAAEESEGFVRVGFTIAADGETKDIVVLDQVGSPAMAKAARLAVARWTYKPATQDGLPVDQYANSAEVVFRAQHVGNAPIHDAVLATYDEGRRLIGEGKYAEGIAVLEQSFDQPLTLYEQAKVSFALAFAYEKSNDTLRALAHIRHALVERGAYLEKAVVPAAQRMRLRIEVANGNLLYAACAAPLPPADTAFDPTGADLKATTKVVDDVMKKLASEKPLQVDATLVAKSGGGKTAVWEHPLSRRRFKFAALVGSVNEFRLSCIRQLTNGPVNETAQWSVPRSVGPCTLRVYGDAGAALKLIEEW